MKPLALGASINDVWTRGPSIKVHIQRATPFQMDQNDAFYRLMVEVMKLQRQKKCIRAAVKSSALAGKPLRLFLFLE